MIQVCIEVFFNISVLNNHLHTVTLLPVENVVQTAERQTHTYSENGQNNGFANDQGMGLKGSSKKRAKNYKKKLKFTIKNFQMAPWIDNR